MGYPMTYRRFVSRNRLAKGDYTRFQAAPYPHVGLDDSLCGFESVEALERAYRGNFQHLNDYRISVERRENGILGDLRRLEDDTVDEGSICLVVAEKAGVDREVVAAVLKEWIAT